MIRRQLRLTNTSIDSKSAANDTEVITAKAMPYVNEFKSYDILAKLGAYKGGIKTKKTLANVRSASGVLYDLICRSCSWGTEKE